MKIPLTIDTVINTIKPEEQMVLDMYFSGSMSAQEAMGCLRWEERTFNLVLRMVFDRSIKNNLAKQGVLADLA